VYFFEGRGGGIRTGGTWRHAGGMSQPPRLFRRKANPSYSARNPVIRKDHGICFYRTRRRIRTGGLPEENPQPNGCGFLLIFISPPRPVPGCTPAWCRSSRPAPLLPALPAFSCGEQSRRRPCRRWPRPAR